MLERVMKDYKLVCCAGKAVCCLETVKKLICCAAFVFAAYESVMLIKSK